MSHTTVLPFVVVEFFEESPKAVAVIPRTWLVGEKECRWPSRPTAADLKKQSDPNSTPKSAWGFCKCRILGQFETYIAGANLAEITSEIEERERRLPQKRHRTDRRQSSSSSKSDNITKISPLKVPIPPVALPQTNFLSSTHSSQSMHLDESEISGITSQLYFDAASGATIEVRENPHPFSSNIMDLSPAALVIPSTHRTTKEATTPKSSSGAGESAGFQRVVLKQLAILSQGQRQIAEDVAAIRDLLENQRSSSTSTNSDHLDFSSLPDFPLQTEAQLSDLEQQLILPDEKRLLVSYLKGIGGKNLDETVKGILKRIISSQLTTRYSFTGRGIDNNAFNTHHNILECIFEATKQNRKLLAEDKTESSIKQKIMDFFRFSKPKNQSSTATESTN
ncbi:hypothetical protein Fcan01_17786 [Folsomia candida]|uniref:DUF4806 domain-containing protein n=1 Tax=Folsomia candida TaxID=158441 RepID=A0A226DRH3_FOLCA|nr:hypothetical protein Fcan01_17786 [Folsomia candida]